MASAHGHIASSRNSVRRAVARCRSLGLASALVILLLAIAAALPVPSLGGASVAVAAIQKAKSFVELMRQRSPGNRLVAHLANTKNKRIAAHERALPKVRLPGPAIASIAPVGALPPALIDIVTAPLPMEMASLEGVPIVPFEAPPGGPPGVTPPPTGGYVFPPGSPNAPPIVTPPGPPETAVPEPTTWVMMLLGFGIIGWSLRRRPHQEQTTA